MGGSMVQFRHFNRLFFILFLSNLATAQEVQDQKLSILISYGLGDTVQNALYGYRYLYPSAIVAAQRDQDKNIMRNVHSVVWSKDSLKSSISDKKSYIQDLDKTVKNNIKQRSFVGVAHSRGAEMLLRYVGKHNPENLKALILVATPVSVGQCAKQKIFGWISSSHCKISVMTDTIASIKNKALPIILLHQEKDNLVSIENSRLLYKELKKYGFKHVHLIIMKTGNHNDILDYDSYNALQKLYKQYELPFDASRFVG